MSIKTALVRTLEGQGKSQFVGVFFYTNIDELILAVDETIDPSVCEYLPGKIQGAAGFNMGGEFSRADEKNLRDYLDGNYEDEEEPPKFPLDSIEFEGFTGDLSQTFINGMHREKWKKFT